MNLCTITLLIFSRVTPSLCFLPESHLRRGIHKISTNLSPRSEEDYCVDQYKTDNSFPSRRSFLSKATTISTAIVCSTLGAMSPNIYPAGAAEAISSPGFTSEVSWPLGKVAFSLLPLAGTSTRRATTEECIVPDTIWTHDQIQGVVNVNVPVRQTVIKLSDEAGGGLLVYNPLAPTPQLMKFMKELESKYGPVRHIILGTVALEHKATFGPFAQNFPKATVWLQPGKNDY